MKNLFLSFAAITALSLVSCDSSDDSGNTAKLNVKLTDAPAKYDAVKIDIKSVEINSDQSGWNSFSVIKPGVYNLLDFRNGMDMLLAEAELPAGRISQMRLVLGNNNSVVVDGVEYPLSTPSAMQSGLKFNWQQTLAAGGAYNVWIDFDAGRSIVKQGNGTYALKPVIRTFSELTDGQIKGYVLPQEAKSLIHVINVNDTIATALPNADGFFMFKGLPSATYKVSYDADASTGYGDVNKENVSVTYGQVTNLGTTTLVKAN